MYVCVSDTGNGCYSLSSSIRASFSHIMSLLTQLMTILDIHDSVLYRCCVVCLERQIWEYWKHGPKCHFNHNIANTLMLENIKYSTMFLSYCEVSRSIVKPSHFSYRIKDDLLRLVQYQIKNLICNLKIDHISYIIIVQPVCEGI